MTNHLIYIKRNNGSEIQEFVHISKIFNYITHKGYYQSMIYYYIMQKGYCQLMITTTVL